MCTSQTIPPILFVCFKTRVFRLRLCLLVQDSLAMFLYFWQAWDYFEQWNKAGMILRNFWGWVLESDAASTLLAGTFRSLELPCEMCESRAPPPPP